MQTILSFDIGIYNLAFANVSIIEVQDANDIADAETPLNASQETNEVVPNDPHIKSLRTVINDWGILCLKSESDSKKNDLNILSRNLIALLYEKFSDVTYHTVLIENQPCMKNPTMKSIQMILYSYFVMQSYLDGRTIDIKFVSASNKLKVKYKTDVSNIKTSSKYLQNKKYVVEYARNYLNITRVYNEKWINVFEKEKKKDDLADAYCQALHFIENNA
jgi:hypothetical protein